MTQAATGVSVRPAGLADIPAIVAVQAGSWRSAYRGIVDDAFLDAIPIQQWIESWRAHFFAGDTHCFVAEREGRVVGFTSVGRTDGGEDLGPEVGELHTIYIEAGEYGRGLGRQLLQTAVEQLRSDGYREAVLWVLEANARARRFYEAGGWKADGARSSDCWGATSVARVRYRLPLAA